MLKMSDLFHPVYIEDKKKLYTSFFWIYNPKTGKINFYEYGNIRKYLFDPSNQIRVSIRNCMIQKPLEFDSEKVRQDFWHEIKVQEKDGFGKAENCFWFYHPVTFVDALGSLTLNAKKLLRVQKRVVSLNILKPNSENSGGIWEDQSGTFCNHAVFLTIRALDKNYKNFLGGQGKIPDNISYLKDDTYIEQYKNNLRPSNIWCDVLEYQSKKTETTGIREISEDKAGILANLGYVVIACWKNTGNPDDGADSHPHFATVAPLELLPDDLTKGEIHVANVGGKCGFYSVTKAFGLKAEIRYYYNSKQEFMVGLNTGDGYARSIEELREARGTWGGTIYDKFE